jgi:type I restriction enzyme M protein
LRITERDIPEEVKRFYKTFEQIVRRHTDIIVLDDFLTLFIANWSKEKELHDEWIKAKSRYSEKEIKLFGELVMIYMEDFSELISSEKYKWFDFFGTLYEFLSSNSKRKGMGQFFTPPSLVDFLTQLQLRGIKPGMNVNDPACGSARFLISAHANIPGVIVFGEDLDLLCCKMSIVNCFMHGCNAQIVWRNSLDLNDYKKGWQVLFPEIKLLQKEESFTWLVNQEYLAELKEQREEKNNKPKSEPEPQLELFGTLI